MFGKSLHSMSGNCNDRGKEDFFYLDSIKKSFVFLVLEERKLLLINAVHCTKVIFF